MHFELVSNILYEIVL